MKEFRLPRKTKKYLKSNFWLYPADKNGCSLMASPARRQKDFLAFKSGILRNILDRVSNKANRLEKREKLDKEIFITDEELRAYVDEIFEEEYRNSSFNTLTRAKNSTKAVTAYYNFINAYQLYENGEDSYGNVCCMSVDHARELLRNKKYKSKK